MTNYPRDEFDRVPEFSNRSGSHRENGWAAAASVGGARSGLRWLMVFGAIALVVGLFSFMVLPKFTGTPTDPASVAASSSDAQEATASSEAAESPSESESPSEASETPAESESAEPTEASSSAESSESPLPEDADTSMAMGVYNGAKVGGLAGKARTELQNAGFSNVAASNWTKKVTYSTVYYRSETHRATAEAAAAELDITSVMQSANIPGNIAIVLGSNFR
ncbi:LytR C-terminal domain-containing protein [Paeniglutamicibacter sp. ABSL32-1]|uniref:LytR C-terminal domain-containing protein n=1 Tax=Paeniglutamicibacter quisquiliarum TaxID=2849498 RepID=UPI001C2D4543|nr:LytR C-terminal domain-containing protein [Paeniglutamicibacter quisquiliarum]MBV1778833.1 LytR C-terminal domain-containing protein [Paeniglutamicibacter quisquiliarum]